MTVARKSILTRLALPLSIIAVVFVVGAFLLFGKSIFGGQNAPEFKAAVVALAKDTTSGVKKVTFDGLELKAMAAGGSTIVMTSNVDSALCTKVARLFQEAGVGTDNFQRIMVDGVQMSFSEQKCGEGVDMKFYFGS